MKFYILHLFHVLFALTSTVGTKLQVPSTEYQAIDYCDPNLCQFMEHIGCGADGAFSNSCPNDAKIVKINNKLQGMILNMMNLYRDYIAHRDITGPACRMATMQWDNELAQLASLHVKQCKLKQYSCHNTHKFGYSGQNLALLSIENERSLEELLILSVNLWFSQIRNFKINHIHEYPLNYTGLPFNQFTLMVNEKNTHIGCAASSYSHQEQGFFLFACNFAVNNIIANPIYRLCKVAGSECATGTNPKYSNLCSTSESYAVNEWRPPKYSYT